MPKVKRRQNLGRIFGVFLGLGLILILLLVGFLKKTGEKGENVPRKAANPTETDSMLIVDLACLAKLSSRQNCDFPVSVAIPYGQGHQIDGGGQFFRTQFFLEDSTSKNFWMFHGVANGTERIATRKFQTKRATLRLDGEKLAELKVPAEMASFTRSWQNGRYVECQPVLVRPKEVERLIPLAYLDRVVQFADLIGQFNATAFIFSGTLLGWRRECSLIPHTNDIDLAMLREQHSDALLRAILTSPTFIVHWVLGRLRDSFQLSVNVDGFKIDLFHIYRSEEGTFVNGMRPEKRQRIRWHYPKMDMQICTAEMHGRLFHIPCDYQKIIESDYGPEKWRKEVDTNAYVWDKADTNLEAMEVYSEGEWPNVYLLVQNKTERFDRSKVDTWMANINKTA